MLIEGKSEILNILQRCSGRAIPAYLGTIPLLKKKMFPEHGDFKTFFSWEEKSQIIFHIFFSIFKQDAVDGLFQHNSAHLKY